MLSDTTALANLVEELKAKGITFEHYDMPRLKLEGTSTLAAGCRWRGSGIRTGTSSIS